MQGERTTRGIFPRAKIKVGSRVEGYASLVPPLRLVRGRVIQIDARPKLVLVRADITGEELWLGLSTLEVLP